MQLVLSKPYKELIKVMLLVAHFPISVQVERLLNVQKLISNRLTKINITDNNLNLDCLSVPKMVNLMIPKNKIKNPQQKPSVYISLP